jgi:hypothetical protein
LVRGINNADWRRLQTKLIDAVPRKKKIGVRLDVEEQDRIQSTCLLNACLLDWAGLEQDDGTPIPYTKDLARKLLFDAEYRRFRDGVVWAASIVAEQIDDDQKETAGNLRRLSAGTSSGERKSSIG